MRTARPSSLAAVVALLALGGCGYNGLVEKDQQASAAWSEVENQLQRRADLIPNLVNAVKGYMGHEQKIFGEIADARAKMLSAGTGPSVAKMDAANQFESTIGKLISITESYPNLKADSQFTRLMDELAGTENRLAVARKRYNDAVMDYNVAVKRIPTVWTARMFGMAPSKDFFKAPESAKALPQVNFNAGAGQ